MNKENIGSYHNVECIVDNKRYKISNNYAFLLMCTRVGGWEFWERWDKHEKLIASEFGNQNFEIISNGVTILKTIHDPTEE